MYKNVNKMKNKLSYIEPPIPLIYIYMSTKWRTNCSQFLYKFRTLPPSHFHHKLVLCTCYTIPPINHTKSYQEVTMTSTCQKNEGLRLYYVEEDSYGWRPKLGLCSEWVSKRSVCRRSFALHHILGRWWRKKSNGYNANNDTWLPNVRLPLPRPGDTILQLVE